MNADQMRKASSEQAKFYLKAIANAKTLAAKRRIEQIAVGRLQTGMVTANVQTLQMLAAMGGDTEKQINKVTQAGAEGAEQQLKAAAESTVGWQEAVTRVTDAMKANVEKKFAGMREGMTNAMQDLAKSPLLTKILTSGMAAVGVGTTIGSVLGPTAGLIAGIATAMFMMVDEIKAALFDLGKDIGAWFRGEKKVNDQVKETKTNVNAVSQALMSQNVLNKQSVDTNKEIAKATQQQAKVQDDLTIGLRNQANEQNKVNEAMKAQKAAESELEPEGQIGKISKPMSMEKLLAAQLKGEHKLPTYVEQISEETQKHRDQIAALHKETEEALAKNNAQRQAMATADRADAIAQQAAQQRLAREKDVEDIRKSRAAMQRAQKIGLSQFRKEEGLPPVPKQVEADMRKSLEEKNKAGQQALEKATDHWFKAIEEREKLGRNVSKVFNKDNIEESLQVAEIREPRKVEPIVTTKLIEGKRVDDKHLSLIAEQSQSIGEMVDSINAIKNKTAVDNNLELIARIIKQYLPEMAEGRHSGLSLAANQWQPT